MKVIELLAALKTCDPEAHVIGFCEDDPAHTRVFEINSAAMCDVVPLRHEDESVGVRFESGPDSVKWAVLEITADA